MPTSSKHVLPTLLEVDRTKKRKGLGIYAYVDIPSAPNQRFVRMVGATRSHQRQGVAGIGQQQNSDLNPRDDRARLLPHGWENSSIAAMSSLVVRTPIDQSRGERDRQTELFLIFEYKASSMMMHVRGMMPIAWAWLGIVPIARHGMHLGRAPFKFAKHMQVTLLAVTLLFHIGRNVQAWVRFPREASTLILHAPRTVDRSCTHLRASHAKETERGAVVLCVGPCVVHSWHLHPSLGWNGLEWGGSRWIYLGRGRLGPSLPLRQEFLLDWHRLETKPARGMASLRCTSTRTRTTRRKRTGTKDARGRHPIRTNVAFHACERRAVVRCPASRNDGRAHEHVDGANASVSEASEEEEERTAWSHAEEKIVKLGEHLDEATVRFEDSGVWLKFIAVFLPFWTAAVYYELYVADRASP